MSILHGALIALGLVAAGAVFSFAFYVCLLAERRMLTTLFFLLSVACYVSFVPVGFAVALAGR